MTRLTSIK